MASSRYVDHLARQSGEVDLFKQAAQLAQLARQHELAAWELAAREAQARATANPTDIHRALEAAFGTPASAPKETPS